MAEVKLSEKGAAIRRICDVIEDMRLALDFTPDTFSERASLRSFQAQYVTELLRKFDSTVSHYYHTYIQETN